MMAQYKDKQITITIIVNFIITYIQLERKERKCLTNCFKTSKKFLLSASFTLSLKSDVLLEQSKY